jgi:arylsulfatase A-like enzyme
MLMQSVTSGRVWLFLGQLWFDFPLVFCILGRSGPVRPVTPASLIDVAPTLATLCNLPETTWQGRDLFVGDLNNPNQPAIFAMHRPIGDWMNVTDWRMIQQDGYKYVWHDGMAEELFDLKADGAELVNLSADEAFQPRLSELKTKLDAFLVQTADPLLANWRTQQKGKPAQN